MQLEISDWEFNITVEFDFIKGKEASYSGAFGNYLPGEPDEIKNLKVFLNGNDITSFVSKDQLDKITDECFKSVDDED